MRETTNLRPSGQAVFLHFDRYALLELDGAVRRNRPAQGFFRRCAWSDDPGAGQVHLADSSRMTAPKFALNRILRAAALASVIGASCPPISALAAESPAQAPFRVCTDPGHPCLCSERLSAVSPLFFRWYRPPPSLCTFCDGELQHCTLRRKAMRSPDARGIWSRESTC